MRLRVYWHRHAILDRPEVERDEDGRQVFVRFLGFTVVITASAERSENEHE